MEFLDGMKVVELHPIERVKRIAHFVGSIVRNTNVPFASHGDHFVDNLDNRELRD